MYEPPRFMSPHTAFKQITQTENSRHPPGASTSTSSAPNAESAAEDDKAGSSRSLLPPDETLALSLSRIGTATQRIIAGTLSELATLPEEEFGLPLHSVVIVGKRLHPLELEFAARWCVRGEKGRWWKVGKEVYGVERESR